MQNYFNFMPMCSDSFVKVKSLCAVSKVWEGSIDEKQVCNCEVEQHIIVLSCKRTCCTSSWNLLDRVLLWI